MSVVSENSTAADMEDFILDLRMDIEESIFSDVSIVGWNTSTLAPSKCNGTVLYKEKMRIVMLIVDVILVTGFSVFGLVGNAVSIAVLRNMRSTTSLLLQALAVVDSLYLLTCLEFQCLSAINYHVPSFRHVFPYFPYLQMTVWPIAGMAQMSTVWLVVLITGERYLAICHPLKVKRSATMTNTRIAIAVVILGAFFFSIPTLFDLRVEVKYCDQDQPEIAVTATSFLLNNSYQLIYKTILCFIFRTSLPLAIVIYFNVCLLKAIRASKRMPTAHRHSPPSEDPNVIIISLVAVFIVCEVPDVVYRTLRTIKFFLPSFPVDWYTMWILGTMTNFMLTVNSSVNVIIYAAIGTRFRRIMLRQLCRKTDEPEDNPVYV